MAKDLDDVLMVPVPEKVIPWDDFVELSAVHVETHLRNSMLAFVIAYHEGAFQIDSEISGAELQERELTAWDDEDETAAAAVSLLSGLDEDGGDWDQFEV
jgi:PAB1-binding protein PBP1